MLVYLYFYVFVTMCCICITCLCVMIEFCILSTLIGYILSMLDYDLLRYMGGDFSDGAAYVAKNKQYFLHMLLIFNKQKCRKYNTIYIFSVWQYLSSFYMDIKLWYMISSITINALYDSLSREYDVFSVEIFRLRIFPKDVLRCYSKLRHTNLSVHYSHNLNEIPSYEFSTRMSPSV